MSALNSGKVNPNVEVVVAPPAPYLDRVKGRLRKDFAVAAQDVSGTGNGAFTGDVSADMLSDLGLRYSIVGHSERRAKVRDMSRRAPAAGSRVGRQPRTPRRARRARVGSDLECHAGRARRVGW